MTFYRSHENPQLSQINKAILHKYVKLWFLQSTNRISPYFFNYNNSGAISEYFGEAVHYIVGIVAHTDNGIGA